MKTRTALIIPDLHIPYHCKKSYQIVLDVGKYLLSKKEIKLEEIVILGDFADFYSVNSHGKHPAIKDTLIEEVDECVKELWKLSDAFPNQDIIFIQGNHEYRLERYLASKAPELYGLTDTRRILELDQMGFKFIPYGRNQMYNILGTDLIARHEPISMGRHTAMSTLDKGGVSMIYGHTHRFQYVALNRMDGKTIRGCSLGSLINKNAPVFNYMKNKDDWSKAFGICYADGKVAHLQPIIIENNRCFFDGKLFK